MSSRVIANFETAVFVADGRDTAVAISVCWYKHMPNTNGQQGYVVTETEGGKPGRQYMHEDEARALRRALAWHLSRSREYANESKRWMAKLRLVSPRHSSHLVLPDPTKLAGLFSQKLRAYVGDKIAAVVARNRAEKNPAVCHSHDFCDANVLMDEAFQELCGVGSLNTKPGGGASEQAGEIWDQAWKLAKESQFTLYP